MTLVDSGHVVLPGFLTIQDEISLDEFFATDQGAGILIELGPEELQPWLSKIVQRVAEQVRIATGKHCPPFEKMWFQRSTSSWATEHENEVPFVPHIDKRRYLKGMLYLSDIDASSGAMLTSGLDPADYERLRRRLPRDYKERRLNVVDLPPEAFLPLCGARGTLILFDTNTPHFAGSIAPGHERRIVRIDFGPLK